MSERPLPARLAIAFSALLVALPAALVPSPAAASPEPASAAQVIAETIEIDGPPVPIAVAPDERVELTYSYDGDGLVQMVLLDCTGPFSFFKELAAGHTQQNSGSCDNPTNGPFEPRGPIGNIIAFEQFQPDGATRTYLVSLVRSPADVTEALPLRGDPVTVTVPERPFGFAPSHSNGSAMLHFTGVAGQQVTFTFTHDREVCAFFRFALRLPDLTTQSLQPQFACPSTRSVTLPQSGEYRIEILSGLLEPTTVTVAPATDAPGACQEHRVAPVLLVHGINGTAGSWELFRQLLVARLTEEFVIAGVEPADAGACAELFVRAASVGPRSNSYANGAALVDQIFALRDDTGASVIDIIAHSKGGLDSRRATQLLGANNPLVRNLLMLVTPHQGTRIADVACGLHNLRPLLGLGLSAASRMVESEVGPCNGPDDALYVLTEDFVRGTFNQVVVDQPWVVYQTVAGDSSCLLCRVLSDLLGPNDGNVPVVSAMGPEPPDRYRLLDIVDVAHADFQVAEHVLDLAYCNLVGRRTALSHCPAGQGPAPAPLAGPIAEAAQVEPTGDLVHVDGLEVAAGATAHLTLPIGGLGAAGIAVAASHDGVTAAMDDLQLVAEATELGHTLTAEIDSPVDLELTVANDGPEAADLLVLVSGSSTEAFLVETSPQLAGVGEPVEIRVAGGAPAAGLVGAVTGPDTDGIELSFTDDGMDAIASFTPVNSGEHAVSVLQTSGSQQLAFDGFIVSSGAAALPGTFAETLETGPDGLATGLHLDVDLDVAEAGDYRLAGQLTTAAGGPVTGVEALAQLAVGESQVRLTVPGAVLYAVGAPGPYQLQLTLSQSDPETGGEIVTAQAAGSTLTSPYPVDGFQPASISPSYVSVAQGDFESTVVEVPVTLSEPVTRPITVEYASQNPPGDEYAHSPDDFEAVSGTLTFLPGETDRTIEVTVHGNPEQQGNKLALIGFTDPINAAVAGEGVGGVAILAEPTASIDAPGADLRWSTGDVVSFEGRVDDPVDGALPDSALSWRLTLHQCVPPPAPGGCQSHELAEWNGVAGGSFVAPDHGYPSHLELELTAQGPSGLAHQIVRELHPETVELTVTSDPPGRLVAAGWPPALLARPTPYAITAIPGSTLTLSAFDHSEGGLRYVFQEWSHGGPNHQLVEVPAEPATYHATYVADLVVVDPPSAAAGEYGAVAAEFGPPPDGSGQAGEIVIVDDGSGAPTEGCGPLIDFPAGAIALVDRGTCPFVQKVRNAQDAGAAAVIVANNEPGEPAVMAGDGPDIAIPSVMVSLDTGVAIKAGLPAAGMVVRLA